MFQNWRNDNFKNLGKQVCIQGIPETMKFHNLETVICRSLMINGQVVKLNYRDFQNKL